MAAILESVEIENFKSFKGKVVIGPLKHFTSVIGPNGSGKSNFMDAISFVMGEPLQSLRVKRMKDLIHGASIGKPVKNRSCVTAVIKKGSMMKRFTRTIKNTNSDYYVDENHVSYSEYLKQLKLFHLNVKAKNFLVFQGTVETIALQDPKERTALFEELSGSSEFVNKYKTLKSDMQTKEAHFHKANRDKKDIVAVRKETLQEKKIVENFHELTKTLDDNERELHILRLFHNERRTEKLENELLEKRKEIEELKPHSFSAEKNYKKLKGQSQKLTSEVNSLEQEIHKLKNDMDTIRPSEQEASLKTKHIGKKLANANLSLEKAKEEHNAREKAIHCCESELKRVEDEFKAFKEQKQSESKQQGRDLELEESQVREYNKLKEEASKLTARYDQHIDSLNREQRSNQDCLDFELQKLSELEERLRFIDIEKNENEKRKLRISELAKSTEEELMQQVNQRNDTASKTKECKEKLIMLQRNLEHVTEQLADAHENKFEGNLRKKKEETLRNLKGQYKGLYGRLIYLLKPNHEKYEVAVTKIMRKNLDAIVVDSQDTAKKCIKYLKTHALERETFLPLDTICAKMLLEHLREIKDPPGVHLLYDVLDFYPQEIEKAVLFATDGTLVCETMEDAEKIGGGKQNPHQRLNVVSLDGTVYYKSGTISGGTAELQRQAKNAWDRKKVHQLKNEKIELLQKIQLLKNTQPQESELNTLDCSIQGLKTRLVSLNNDLKCCEKRQNELVPQKEENIRKQAVSKSLIKNLKQGMQSSTEKLQKLVAKRVHIEDAVFKKFCSAIGVPHIRVYEEQGLKNVSEYETQCLEYERKRNQIENGLVFEKSHQTKESILRWEEAIQNLKNDLKTATKQQAKINQLMARHEEKLKNLQACFDEKCKEVETHTTCVQEAEENVKGITETINKSEKQLILLEKEIEQVKFHRHNLLNQCKIRSIQVEMDDSPESVISSSISESTGTTNSRINTQELYDKERRLNIDYSALKEEYRSLEDIKEIEEVENRMEESINTTKRIINSLSPININVEEDLHHVEEQLENASKELTHARHDFINATKKFELVKKERFNSFMNCFDSVANKVDEIYKELTRSQSGSALLIAENSEEPYLGGISYSCIVPRKNCQPMHNLSGGEKTLAAVALLMAFQLYRPSPFFVFDEIDAALDNINIEKLGIYLSKTSPQTIVISLKEELYCHADALIGICSNAGKCTESKVLTYDLTKLEN